ncbi:MMPL family transporter [Marmoricola sp. OAE513]|uniref:MMPL family transporter n=1 Tax=Marmoricola sp. OAE513 TaxID=2817894 RepID=UPI001AE35D8B
MDTNQTHDKKPGRSVKAILRLPLVTMGLWVVLGALGMAFLPSVDHVVASQSNGGLPKDAPTLAALTKMDDAFGSGRARSFVLVVFENKDKLTAVDEAAYTSLVAKLKSRTDYVADVQDYVGDADKKKALTSTDGQATYLPVGLTADFGTVQSNDQVKWVREQVKASTASLAQESKVYVTGDPANLIDMTALATKANEISGIVSMVLLFVILLLIYRRFASVFVPLVTIGIATLCTNSVLSLAGQAGMGLSTYTESFCVAIVLGAGTDYSIFLISRFREEYARTGDVYQGVAQAMIKIGPALLASAGTVAISSMVLNFAQLSVFATTGPAMAVAVSTTVLIAMTVTPAMLLLVGRRIGPAPAAPENSFWNRTGRYVAAKPGRILLAGTAVLVLLTAFIPTVTMAYSEKPDDPSATEAASGQKVLDDHFGKYTTQPDYVLISADHDMRNSRDLAVLAAASRDVAKLDNVASVRSAAQPGGEALKDARITSTLDKVATQLGSAADDIKGGKGGLNELKNGTASLASGADQQAAGMRQAASAMPRLINGMAQLTSGTSRSAGGARQLASGADQIRGGLRDLANGLEQARSGLSQSTNGIGQVLQALNSDPFCAQSPICPQARAGLAQIYNGQKNRLVPGLSQASRAASQLAGGQGKISDGLRNLANGLNRSVAGHQQLNGGQRSLYGGLNQLASGSQQLANGLDKLPPGISDIVENTIKLGDGLDKTSDVLGDVKEQSDTSEAAGFYLPTSALDNEKFASALSNFLSSDGRVARIQIIGATDPSANDGLNRFDAAKDRVAEALQGTTLDGSKIETTGAAGGAADLRHYFKADFKLVLIAVLLTVLVLMMIVLRSLIAPLYLLLSVILSYGAALGLTVILFHQILGQDMPFNVPVLSFVLLVAVGADYNILLMSRMRETRGRLTPRAVGEAVTATGPVITSAGIIFASAFLPMVASTLSAVAQLCFTVVVGLLLDTFVVRTLIVPACAALLGDKSWWPGRSEDAGTSVAATAGPGFSLPKPKILAPPIMTADTL